MKHTESSRSLKEKYQDYVVSQQKTGLLLHEYNEKKEKYRHNANLAKKSLDNTKQLLLDLTTKMPTLEEAKIAIDTQNSSFNVESYDQVYCQLWKDLKIMDAHHSD